MVSRWLIDQSENACVVPIPNSPVQEVVPIMVYFYLLFRRDLHTSCTVESQLLTWKPKIWSCGEYHFIAVLLALWMWIFRTATCVWVGAIGLRSGDLSQSGSGYTGIPAQSGWSYCPGPVIDNWSEAFSLGWGCPAQKLSCSHTHD